MKDIFQERNMNYSLRHGKDAQVPKVRATSFGIETITYFGSRLRQLLPQEIKQSNLEITVEIKNLMKERDLAKKRSEKDASYWSDYKKLRNEVTSELRARVQEYYYNLIDETQNNPKAMWKTINKVLHKNSNHTVTQNIIFEGTELKSV